jgi:ankyrin repeat protein
MAAIFLISWGANILNSDNELGMTPLHLATLAGSIRLVRKLLLRGADKYKQDFSGKIPLDIANESSFETIKALL